MPSPLAPSLPADAAMRRVSAIARRMQWLTLCGIAMTLAGMIALWFWLSDAALEQHLRRFLEIRAAEYRVLVSMPYRLAGFVITAGAASVLVGGLMEARKLFAAFAHGMVFTLETALRLRRVALMVTAFSAVVPLTKTLLGLALVSGDGPGPYMLVIVNFGDFALGLLGGLLLAIAWAMVEAARIARENEGFV
ncbi:DUF2975 domain-containing protein [Cupriavidus basilensis]|uniref:DUF2975 domain-containing protein n=1 Tax=Cupriavidus basilensis TaxID=68895 RepID=A0ABT6AY59_9BURK|nr:DUF2975 domain-containing protein [Cupriavidus basilensis]MDF3837429.1 DUF2975 domain-containing protein [Cupriavidus basilensis]